MRDAWSIAKTYLTSKGFQNSQWRFLKFFFFFSFGYLVAFSRTETAFFIWASSFVLSLFFILSVRGNPFWSILGLIFTPLSIPFLLVWTVFWRVGKFVWQLVRFKVGFILNSSEFTSIRALIVGAFLFSIATVLTIRGTPTSGLWRAALYLNVPIGILLLLQLMCLCREPLAPLASFAETIEALVSMSFESMKEHRASFMGLLVHAGFVDNFLKKLVGWAEREELANKLKSARTTLFVIYWAALFVVGTTFFTNIFVLTGATGKEFSFAVYVDMFLTVTTALTGNLLGNIPSGLFFKAIFSAVCILQTISVVLLVLVYSLSVEADIQRIRRAIAKSSTKSSELLLSKFEELIGEKGAEVNLLTVKIVPDMCQFKLPNQKDWVSFAQLKQQCKEPKRCRIKTSVPIRRGASLVSFEAEFSTEVSTPQVQGAKAKKIADRRYRLPIANSGFCDMEFDSVCPANTEQLIGNVLLAYADSEAPDLKIASMKRLSRPANLN